MSRSDELTALAERVMALAGPDRETFMAAFDACHPMPPPDCEPAWRAENPKQPIYHAWKTRQMAFIKLVSAEAWLDAAMTLVPEGNEWLWDARSDGFAAVTRHTETAMYWEQATAATPAIALTAAALLARAALGEQP